MNKSGVVAKGGVVAGLCVIFLYLASVLATGRMAFLACTGFLLMIAMIETSAVGSWTVYGCYPLLKKIFERAKSLSAAFFFKLLFFNADAVVIYWLATGILGIPVPFTGWMLAGGVVLLNGIFLLYDYLLAALFDQYLRRIYGRRRQN
jgi:hypothetical protein